MGESQQKNQYKELESAKESAIDYFIDAVSEESEANPDMNILDNLKESDNYESNKKSRRFMIQITLDSLAEFLKAEGAKDEILISFFESEANKIVSTKGLQTVNDITEEALKGENADRNKIKNKLNDLYIEVKNEVDKKINTPVFNGTEEVKKAARIILKRRRSPEERIKRNKEENEAIREAKEKAVDRNNLELDTELKQKLGYQQSPTTDFPDKGATREIKGGQGKPKKN